MVGTANVDSRIFRPHCGDLSSKANHTLYQAVISLVLDYLSWSLGGSLDGALCLKLKPTKRHCRRKWAKALRMEIQDPGPQQAAASESSLRGRSEPPGHGRNGGWRHHSRATRPSVCNIASLSRERASFSLDLSTSVGFILRNGCIRVHFTITVHKGDLRSCLNRLRWWQSPQWYHQW